MTLARRIRDCRYAKGWGPDELAARAEISRTALYQIESGKTETPRAGTLRRIAIALGVSIEVLLGQEPIPMLSQEEDQRPTPEWGRNSAPRAHLPENAPLGGGRPMSVMVNRDRAADLDRKFHALLLSPLGESVARIVEESYQLLRARARRDGL